ncbi:MAG: 4-aminobutyrate--2-oxoglutarate transaminase [Acetobacteraceae bacterium]|nr:4-aminobutyrate--2-oxoglutarate transaminase [Acetobacteraceae bacterium]
MGLGRFAQVKGEIPGPRSRALLEAKERFVPRAFSIHLPAVIAQAKGALITDIDGNTFIDLAGGVGVLNVGHCPDEVVDALRDQVGRFIHTDFSVVPYECYIELAQKLAALAPGRTPKKCCFFNCGAEAVENSIKIARAYTKKRAVIAFEGAFHGRTLMCMTLTSKIVPYKDGFGPFAPEVYRIPYAYCYRCPVHLQHPSCGLACADELERAFVARVSANDTAAVIIEPVQGEGGFVVPPRGYLSRIKGICEKHRGLFIADEIQTGFGRTGRMFALEHEGVEPDIMAVAKSLAAGMPLSGVVGKAEIMDAPGDSAIGGTYVGNPVGCVAALKVLELMERLDLPGRALAVGERIASRFRRMAESYPLIGDVRALGAMVGVELVRDRGTKQPAPQETGLIIKRAMSRGVLTLRSGIYGNVIRFLAPLVITEDQLDEALDILEEAFSATPPGSGA